MGGWVNSDRMAADDVDRYTRWNRTTKRVVGADNDNSVSRPADM